MPVGKMVNTLQRAKDYFYINNVDDREYLTLLMKSRLRLFELAFIFWHLS